jgi:secreted trypsin-like serine protease
MTIIRRVSSPQFLFCAISVFALMTAALIAPASAVVSGQPLLNPPIEAPWAVSLWVNNVESGQDNSKFICTGSLISAQVVITSANCVQNLSGPLFVQYGGKRLGEGDYLPVDSVWVRAGASAQQMTNDIGLAHLLLPVPLTRFPKLDLSLITGNAKSAKATLLGWGADQSGTATGDLRSVNVSFQAAAATRVYGKGFNPKAGLAAGAYDAVSKKYSIACTGDAGAPLFVGSLSSPTIVGIASASAAQSCNSSVPTVFARVAFYKKDLSSGQKLLITRAVTASIAAPLNLKEPSISGTQKVGLTLTCNPGQWTKNATGFSYQWVKTVSRGSTADLTNATQIGSDGKLVLTKGFLGSRIVCVVRAIAAQRSSYAVAFVDLAGAAGTASFVSPPEGSTVSGPFNLTANVSLSAGAIIDKICLKIDGARVNKGFYDGTLYMASSDANGCQGEYGSMHEWELDTSYWSGGTHTFTLYVIDSNGMQTATVTRSLTLTN